MEKNKWGDKNLYQVGEDLESGGTRLTDLHLGYLQKYYQKNLKRRTNE